MIRIIGFISVLAASLISTSASADTRIERKIAQFGGPEVRMRCVKEGWTWGLPYNCKWGGQTWRNPGGHLRCDRDKIKTCIGHAYDLKQHEYFLVVTGPDAPDAAKKVLRGAAEKALAAGLAAAIATPGEVLVKTAAGLAAAEAALPIALAAEPMLSSLKDEFDISIDEKSNW